MVFFFSLFIIWAVVAIARMIAINQETIMISILHIPFNFVSLIAVVSATNWTYHVNLPYIYITFFVLCQWQGRWNSNLYLIGDNLS